MSDPESSDTNRQSGPHANSPEDKQSTGLNLTLAYSLIALALIAAIGFALLIVLPFYHRH